MQIKLSHKMAKNNGVITCCANTVQENERMLNESCYKTQVETKSKEEFEKLFQKLNYICQAKSNKGDAQLSSAWCNKNVKGYVYGNISGFASGAWWGIRMDCSRDRIHDPFDENVQNGPFGVTSICTSNNNLNEDVDFGNALTITGQSYIDGELDKDPLIKNYEDQIPIRLVRSYNLFNEFAPKTGYRYDGLYQTVNFWIGINPDGAKHYKFALLRLNDQEAPLWDVKQPPLGISNSTSALHSLSTPVRNCVKATTPNVYEFRRYSHGSEGIIRKGKHEKSNGFSQFLSPESNKVDEKESGTSESAIVTRHVFKKANSNVECTPSTPSTTVMSENKSLNLIGSQGSKAHNTNISIRTGLYNSSHSTQHESKNLTSTPFCRSAKTLALVKSNQHVENWSLPNKEKGRNIEGKNEFPKRVNYVSYHAGETKSAKTKFGKDPDAQVNACANGTSSTTCFKYESNTIHKEVTNNSTNIRNGTPNTSDTPTNMLNITNCMYKNECSTHKISHKEVQEFKALDSLDSLTPDKILHLINSRGHPLSKLLIGNMIGLTSEQSLALQTSDQSTSQPEVKNKMVLQENVTENIKQRTNFEVVSDDLTESRCYKFRRRRKLSRRIINKPEMLKYSKMRNEKLKKGFAQSSTILNQHLTSFTKYDSSKNVRKSADYQSAGNETAQPKKLCKKKPDYLQKSRKSVKNNVGNKRSEGRMHLRAMRTLDSSIKKHMNKKQQREITNLLIDAKIGPKIRGPRYRRLRCINNTFAKQSYDRSETGMHVLNKCKDTSERSSVRNKNARTKMANCKHVKGKERNNNKTESKIANLEQNKVDRNLTTPRKIVKGDIAKKNSSPNNKMNNDDNDNIANKNDNNGKSRYIENSVHTVKNKDTPIIQSRKRKPMQPVYAEPECTKIDGHLHRSCEKEMSRPSKSDAVTQCSLIREPLARNLKLRDSVPNSIRNEQYTFVKIEYGDLKDMKSEVYEATKLKNENKEHSKPRSDRKSTSCSETVYNIQHSKNANVSLTSSIKEQKMCSSPERVSSAFVPVNIPDNDLKIARLRSIGFKPINFCNNDEDGNSQSKVSKVLKQNVAEKYNKYTNEENDIVVYMDDELQYLDIENEDKNSLSIRRKVSDLKAHAATKEEQSNRAALQKDSLDGSLLEQDLESPWHGWKKVVTNKDTYWVGW